MTNTNTEDSVHISFSEAKKKIMDMNLINNFLMDSAMEDPEDAKTIARIIISTVLNADFEISDVHSEKLFTGIDTALHGIRMDAHLTAKGNEKIISADVYDVEMEDREAERPYLPKRLRYYSAISDSKLLPSSSNYDLLPDFISITILSYDPFLLGDMYYEAKMQLMNHPDYNYDEGRLNIFLYAGGNPNFSDPDYGKKVADLLKYIVSGSLPDTSNNDIEKLDAIVSKVKSRSEVTAKLMRQWDRELSIRREITEEVTREVTKEVTKEVTTERDEKAALNLISFCHSQNIPDESIRKNLEENYHYTTIELDSLFEKASLKS